MLVAMKNGWLVLADEAKGRTGYCCPDCHEPVILRRGRHKIAHFAHRPGSHCRLSEGETAEHLLGKRQLFQWYRQKGRQVALEVYLPRIAQRPDLLLTDNDQRVAIEFQCSPLSLKRLRERNAGYRRCGIAFHWLLGAPYQRRRLQRAKVAQFTQWINGRPGLLFWDTRLGRLVVKHNFARCSFIHGVGQQQLMIVKTQAHYLDDLQYGHGAMAARQLLFDLPDHRPLAACPMVCHDVIPTWPVLDEPVIMWRIRVAEALINLPIFHYWSRQDWQIWLNTMAAKHWLGFGCIDGQLLHQTLFASLTHDLLTARILITCPGGYLLFQYPHWFINLQEKMNFLARGGFDRHKRENG